MTETDLDDHGDFLLLSAHNQKGLSALLSGLVFEDGTKTVELNLQTYTRKIFVDKNILDIDPKEVYNDVKTNLSEQIDAQIRGEMKKDDEGLTLEQKLFTAIVNGTSDEAYELVKQGVDVNAPSPSNGFTALHLIAATQAHAHLVAIEKAFKEHGGSDGFNYLATCSDGRLSSVIALENGHSAEFVELLLERENRQCADNELNHADYCADLPLNQSGMEP